ncbi:MAG: radical SAM protein [Desulfurococcales archaeon]|nr:radical SAM protein [Desulfurococcales archaeon]
MLSANPKVSIFYPGPRSVAYSSLAFFFFREYLGQAGVSHDGFFLEEGGITVEGRAPSPRHTTAILASLPYELLYPDLARMLSQAGIPVLRGQRGPEDPIVIVGGPAVTANPLPVSGMADAVLVGEAEPVIDEILDALSMPGRSSRLRALSEIKGLYVPEYANSPVERVYEPDLDKAWYPTRQEVPRGVEPVWGRSFMLETTRGCSRFCRFCMEGHVFLPKRDRSYGRLRELLEEGVRESRTGKVSFYSLIFFDNPASDTILEHAVSMGLEVSVPSIRAETLTPERAELIARGGQRTITIAPETGSCTIARAVRKPIGREGGVEASRIALEAGIRNIKLYIMTGFPGETEEDRAETVGMVRDIALMAAKKGGQVRVSLNPLIPKPMTPLQWLGFNAKEAGNILAETAKAMRKAGARVSVLDPKIAAVQVILSRGDEKLSPVIALWSQKGGLLGSLKAAARELGVRLEPYIETWPLSLEPPWHRVVVDKYAKPRWLRRELEIYMDIVNMRDKTRMAKTACKPARVLPT